MTRLYANSSITAELGERSGGRALALAAFARIWPWLFLILLLVFFELWSRVAYSSSFVFNTANLQSIGVFTVAPLLLALGQTYVIIAGGIDLSVGFIMGLATVVMALVIQMVEPAVGAWDAFILGCAAGLAGAAVPGLINGLLISALRVPPFIGTLGMYGVARGAGFLLAGGTTVPVSNPILFAMGNGHVGGVPVPVLITAALVIVMQYGLAETRYGQYTYAIGGNRAAAIRAGIDTHRHTRWLYVIAALTAGAGGLIYTARFSAGAAQAGEPLLLDSIAAVVIGGASLFGGSGTIIGTVIGALIIAVIQYGLVFVNVEPFWQFIAVGTVIVLSVLVDQSQVRLTAGAREE